MVSNDLEPYGRILAECLLANAHDVPWDRLHSAIALLNEVVETAPSEGGFIERLYAPDDDENIQSRNLASRSLHVTEHLYLVDRAA